MRLDLVDIVIVTAWWDKSRKVFFNRNQRLK